MIDLLSFIEHRLKVFYQNPDCDHMYVFCCYICAVKKYYVHCFLTARCTSRPTSTIPLFPLTHSPFTSNYRCPHPSALTNHNPNSRPQSYPTTHSASHSSGPHRNPHTITPTPTHTHLSCTRTYTQTHTSTHPHPKPPIHSPAYVWTPLPAFPPAFSERSAARHP